MSVTVDVAVPAGRIPLSRAAVRDTVRSVLRAEGVRNAVLSVAFVGDRAMAAHNRHYLGRRGTTDVIAFALESPVAPDGAASRTGRGSTAPESAGVVLGDIYIAPAVARRNARRFGSTVREELVRLVIHGTLHVLGHDHPEGEHRTRSPMWQRQEALVARMARGPRRR
ncbi:MAG TPA: rRNA maturation RNase YbeY [Gemmatimonadaceae bacterium]|nr:rRNA maturation RNase YbeY [Gemmatimonadaceae bacterium]